MFFLWRIVCEVAVGRHEWNLACLRDMFVSVFFLGTTIAFCKRRFAFAIIPCVRYVNSAEELAVEWRWTEMKRVVWRKKLWLNHMLCNVCVNAFFMKNAMNFSFFLWNLTYYMYQNDFFNWRLLDSYLL